MKRTIVFGIVGMALFVVASAAFAADKTKSEEAFDRLASLKGEWKGEINGVDTTLIYTLTAKGSALMEECRPEKGPEMITMFTIDGDHLIATHYCSAKNQPQMATSTITDAQKPLAFSLVQVTGLKSADDWHNTGLTVIQEDNDHLTQEWSYQFKGKSGKNIFHFTRVRPEAT
jgi:alpha-amylase/alpha-mannosidase (GH57 family)